MSTATILKERGDRYGEYADHSRIALSIVDAMVVTPGWGRLDAVQSQALRIISDKIARILNGDPDYSDSWIDIAGYATLVANWLESGKTTCLKEP